jgi:cysteine desulfurase
MAIYFDNAATTKPMDLAIDCVTGILKNNYGNPSSLHHLGVLAEEAVTDSRERLSNILKVDSKEIYFTSGGTESNNLAVIGVAKAYHRSGKHIITTMVEHPSVLEPIRSLEDNGYEVTYLPINQAGVINIDDLEAAIRPDTILVSIMHVNNIIGSVMPLQEIGKLIKSINKNIVFHVDGVQSFGKLIIQPKKWGIDCLSISGHKLHGPKGIGAIYINSKIKIQPIIFGGHQQMSLRSGTENVPGIAALGVVSEYMYNHIEEHAKHLYNLKIRLRNGLLNNIDGCTIHGNSFDQSAPNILNVRFEHVLGEVLLHALEEDEIYISTGSACASNKSESDRTLSGIGLSPEESRWAVRFSFSIYNTEYEVDQCIHKLAAIIPMLRRFKRK